MATVRVFNHHVHTSFYWLVLADMLLFILSVYAGTYIYCMIEAEQASFYTYLPLIPGRAMTFSVATAVCLFAMGLYEPRMREGRAGVLLRSLGGFLVASVVVYSVFIFLPDAAMWEEVLLYTVLVAFSANLVTRLTFSNVTDLDQFKNRVLVYGSGAAASTISSSTINSTKLTNCIIVAYDKS